MPQIHALRNNPFMQGPEGELSTWARQYDNNSIPRNQQDLAGLRELSAAAYQNASSLRVWRHGAGPHDTADIFYPPGHAAPGPALVFVHGGRWRLNTSRETAFWASAANAMGWTFIGLNFPPIHESPLAGMVASVSRAMQALFAATPDLGLDADRMVLAGHSSGAHLALSSVLALGAECSAPTDANWRTRLRALYLLCGLYDLQPLSRCTPPKELGFDEPQALAMSPLLALQGAEEGSLSLPPVLVGAGADESPEYLRQARALHWELARQTEARWQWVEGAAHFDAALEFNRPDSLARRFLGEALSRPGATA